LRLASHLYRRAGFGATWAELTRALAEGPRTTLERLIAPPDDLAAFNAGYDAEEAAGGESDATESLRAWWLHRMLRTPYPLLEKLTLFWHSYFGTSNARVKSAALMRQHLALVRRHALGKFDALLGAAVRDPALLLSLEAPTHRKARPATHFARTLLSDYTLGAGNFSEQDVADTARAFTGMSVSRKEFAEVPREHDDGAKTILGWPGAWDADGALGILLGAEATARHVVRALYCALVAETDEAPDTLLAPLVATFRGTYDIAALVARILGSNLFFASYGERIKSPVEFAVGLVRALEGLVPTSTLGKDLAALGQNLCMAPTAKGWAGGSAWISSATMVGRANLALALLRGSGSYGNGLDPLAVAAAHGRGGPEEALEFLAELLLGGAVDAVRVTAMRGDAAGVVEPGVRARQYAHALCLLPEYQLA
jgi:uncharacterized protein (DUF1800 family)